MKLCGNQQQISIKEKGLIYYGNYLSITRKINSFVIINNNWLLDKPTYLDSIYTLLIAVKGDQEDKYNFFLGISEHYCINKNLLNKKIIKNFNARKNLSF
jgi:hypothetical protein